MAAAVAAERAPPPVAPLPQWRVIHAGRVAIRAAAANDVREFCTVRSSGVCVGLRFGADAHWQAAIIGAAREGDVVEAVGRPVGNWIRLAGTEPAAAKSGEAWMMVSGRDVGLDQLLERVVRPRRIAPPSPGATAFAASPHQRAVFCPPLALLVSPHRARHGQRTDDTNRCSLQRPATRWDWRVYQVR